MQSYRDPIFKTTMTDTKKNIIIVREYFSRDTDGNMSNNCTIDGNSSMNQLDMILSSYMPEYSIVSHQQSVGQYSGHVKEIISTIILMGKALNFN
jgi:hypothetical protein